MDSWLVSVAVRYERRMCNDRTELLVGVLAYSPTGLTVELVGGSRSPRQLVLTTSVLIFPPPAKSVFDIDSHDLAGLSIFICLRGLNIEGCHFFQQLTRGLSRVMQSQ